MGITEKLNEVKAQLKEIKHKNMFKKANAKREAMIELQTALAKCRGQLEVCLKDFNHVIKTQSRNIQEGLAAHADVAIQEQLLWDAAIGYMLVKDAIYSLKTVTSNNSIAYGYEMLDVAVAQMNGKTKKMPTYGLVKGKQFRNRYGYITSEAVKQEKIELLEGFFEDLKVSGDIEACLENAHDSVTMIENNRKNSGKTDKLSKEYLDSLLGGKTSADISDDDAFDINDIDD